NTTVSSTIPSPHPGLAEPSELARRLGHAGLIPFVGGALFVWLLVGRMDPQPFAFVVSAFTSYAALVVAFLGGLPWGLGMLRQHYHQAALPAEKRGLAWGVGYVIASWVALQMPPHAGLAALGGLLIGCYLVDRKCYPDLGAAGWLKLRFRLTVMSSLSCFLAAAQL
ncbi:DUF3429 domain-containing protein, partial [Aquabacterium sp.]|uniref:DUF3429 domain-containing protein n=1 Tax=Aquabacterium sp. TaxID=1872578 RepID=UPI003D6D6087